MPLHIAAWMQNWRELGRENHAKLHDPVWELSSHRPSKQISESPQRSNSVASSPRGLQKSEFATSEDSNVITDNEKVLLPQASNESELCAWLCPREYRENKIVSVSSWHLNKWSSPSVKYQPGGFEKHLQWEERRNSKERTVSKGCFSGILVYGCY